MLFLSIIICTIIYYIVTNRQFLYCIAKTFRRDMKVLIKFIVLNVKLSSWERSNKTIPKLFHDWVKKQPNKIAIYFEEEQWTYKQLEDFSNQVANYFKQKQYKRGDTIALVMENKPEYVGIWLGLSKIGVTTALINTNLVNDPILHSIRVANSKSVIVGTDLLKTIENVKDKLKDLELFKFDKNHSNESCNIINLHKELEKQSIMPPIDDIEKGKSKDKLMYIYTSGTTGLPKAAMINHIRFFFIACGLNEMSSMRYDDIIYDCLPLYHSSGGIAGVGQCLLFGLSVVIRKKFSATNFWKDCVKYNCTIAQYIGEICRYILVAHGETGPKISHSVRMMTGNGLRSQIWETFVKRFDIEQIVEFYGSTEGNSNLINTDSAIGAVGFVPIYAESLYPVTLIKCNEDTCEPIRDANGFCIRCKPEEPGIFVGKIDPKKAVNSFSGYADKSETEKKIMSDVFKKGDCYFNSGDILVKDNYGYYYFKDRTGDTFRWKGENVATSEVEAVISNVINLNDAVVYGVQIPDTEGRAGMVAIVDENNTLDKEKLCRGLKENLPSYAMPIFLRIMKTVPMTGTFKLKKKDLQQEGFDITKIKDTLYIYDAKNTNYVELTKQLHQDILNKKLRL